MLDLELLIAKQERHKILTRHAVFDFFEDSVNMWEFDPHPAKKIILDFKTERNSADYL